MTVIYRDDFSSPSTKVNKLLKFFLTNVEPPGRSLVAFISVVGVCTMSEQPAALQSVVECFVSCSQCSFSVQALHLRISHESRLGNSDTKSEGGALY